MAKEGTYNGAVYLNRLREVRVVPIRACLELGRLAGSDVQIGDVGTSVARVRRQDTRVEIERSEGVVGFRCKRLIIVRPMHKHLAS